MSLPIEIIPDDTPARGGYTIVGRRWFDRINGNTYFTAYIYKGRDLLTVIPYQYGYGDQYRQAALDWFIQEGLYPAEEYPNTGSPKCWWEFNQENLFLVHDVKRKKDL